MSITHGERDTFATEQTTEGLGQKRFVELTKFFNADTDFLGRVAEVTLETIARQSVLEQLVLDDFEGDFALTLFVHLGSPKDNVSEITHFFIIHYIGKLSI